MRKLHILILVLPVALMYGNVYSGTSDFEAFINNFEEINLPNTIPSKDIKEAGIKPELTQMFYDADYPVKGDRGDGFYVVSAYGLLKKTENYIAVIIHTRKHTAEKYFLVTYTPDGKKIGEVLAAKFPKSLTTARMLTARVSADGIVNTTGTDEILIKGEGYKDVEMDITYVIMEDGTITTDESTDPESGAYNDSGCNEEEIQRIDEIKFTIAHQLINAKTLNTTTEDGAKLTAFYLDSDLIKLSVDAENFMQEIYVSKGFPVCFEVTSFNDGTTLVEHYYFRDYKLVCREVPATGEKSGPPDEPETDLIAGFDII